jgi:hypothetical protein
MLAGVFVRAHIHRRAVAARSYPSLAESRISRVRISTTWFSRGRVTSSDHSSAHSSLLFIISMPNALSQMMVPRAATPEHLRLKPPASRNSTHLAAHQLKASTPEEPLSPTKSQLKKENKRLKKELAEALRARETTPPSGRRRGREEESTAMSSAEKRARGSGMFQSGVIPSPSM